jgi:uncharacterized protein YdhG (YjbR/CyaY superfamily)/DNA-binding transcriptional MerR regulator
MEEKIMEYCMKEMSLLSGLTARTLRYYDEIGLLRPGGLRSSGYRFYGGAEVDRLQQILFYRELGLPLEEIKKILDNAEFNRETALISHLAALKQQKNQLNLLIRNLQKTIRTLKGEQTMSDQDKFEGFKQKMIDENEAKYGEEVRQKYGDEVAHAANQKIKNMTQQQMEEAAKLSIQVNDAIGKALATKDPKGEAALAACGLHQQWLCVYWPDGYYRPEAHKGLAEMYCQDPRFREYYEKIGPNCADFLKKAINYYCDQNAGLTEAAVTKTPDSRKNPKVDAYIEAFPEEARAILENLREMILKEAPKATEKIAYGMPTYTMQKNLIHFAGYKKHIGIYPTPDGIEAFKEELSTYKNSKGAVQFPLDRPMPWDLIQKMIQYRVANQH